MKQNRCKTALDNVCKNKATAVTTATAKTPNNEDIKNVVEDTKKETIRKFIKSRRH